MSSYTFSAKNKKTGIIVKVQALDDHFGRHKYGYEVGHNRVVYTQDEFDKKYEHIEETPSPELAEGWPERLIKLCKEMRERGMIAPGEPPSPAEKPVEERCVNCKKCLIYDPYCECICHKPMQKETHKDRTPDNQRYIIDPLSGCWMWKMSLDRGGYAVISAIGERKMLRGHRYFYEKYKGKIPEGLDIDHLCRNKSCVNPEHLEAVTRGINIDRGMAGKQWGETFKTFYDEQKGGSAQWLVAPSTVEVFILGILKEEQKKFYQKGSQETKNNIQDFINGK